MADITLSKAVRSNLLNLQSTADALSKTQEKLATGKKVNSALDNPNNFFTSSALNSRAGDLASLLDSTSNGIKTIEAADNGLSAITKTVETLQATARQARQDKSFKAESFSVDENATGSLSFKGGSVGNSAVNIGLKEDDTPAVQSTVTASGSYQLPVAPQNAVRTGNATYSAPGATTQASITGGVNFTPPAAATVETVVGNSAFTSPAAAVQSTVTAETNYQAPAAAQSATTELGAFAAIDLSNDANDKVTFDVNHGVGSGTTTSITLDRNGAGAGGPGADNIYQITEAVNEINHQLGGTGITASHDGTSITFTDSTAGDRPITVSNAANVEDTTTAGGGITGTIGAGTAGTQSQIAGTGFTTLDVSGGTDVTFTVDDGAGTQAISLSSTDTAAGARADNDAFTIDEAVAEINAQITAGGTATNVVASNQGGEIVFTAKDAGDTQIEISLYDATGLTGGDTGLANATDTGTALSAATANGVGGVTAADGSAAETNTITIDLDGVGGNAALSVTLTDAHDTAEKAADFINSEIASGGVNYANQVSVSADSGKLNFSGLADGSNTVTIGGNNTDVDEVIGTNRVTNPDVAGAVAETVDFAIHLGGNTLNVQLTAANAGNPSDAKAAIEAAITGDSNFAGVTVSVGDGTGGTTNNALNLSGPADGGDISLSGDSAAVFGSSPANVNGVAKEELNFSIQEAGGSTVNITLDSANANTAADAVTAINTAINATGSGLENSGIEASLDGGKLVIKGKADGTNTPVIAGADADTVFGASAGRAVDVAADANRSVKIGDGTTSIDVELTSANAGTAADAAVAINAAIDANANLSGRISAQVTAGGALELVGEAGDGNEITIGNGVALTADETATFGAAPSDTAGIQAIERTVTIGDGTNSIDVTLNATNGATAADAAQAINDAIAADADLAGTITASYSGNELSLAGKTDGSNSVSATGVGVTDVFGSSRTTVNGAEVASPTKSVDTLVSEINSNTELKGKIRASNDNGKLRIENLSTEDLEVGGVSSTSGKLDGSSGDADIGGNTVRKGLVNQFNELRNQLDKLADDASFNGINLLRGDKLKLTFNETGTSTIEIQAQDSAGKETSINVNTLDIDAASNALFDDDDQIDSQLNKLGDALNVLRSHSSDFGSNLSIVQNRQDFTKEMINTLETGAANLTLADTNEEAANLLALQTRQQLSSTALSLSSQADQAVLRLF